MRDGWRTEPIPPKNGRLLPLSSSVEMNRSSQNPKRSGPLVIAALTLLLLALHQDYWLWNDSRLVLGMLPIGLFWHLLVSLAATALWYLATRIAWPLDPSNTAAGSRSNQGVASHGAIDSPSKEGRS